jgi:predicted DCC family thiol-disulfide oxidoreductase YuxK
MKFYSPYHFSFFRIILGIYMVVHFISLVPYAPELFSSEGIFPEASLNFTYGIFPNILNYLDTPLQTKLFVIALVVISFLFACGIQRRLCALLLWYGWACLFNRNNLISNPGIPFVGWLLLAAAVIEPGEPFSLAKKREEVWRMSGIIFTGAWIIMAAGYTISGIDKMNSPSWMDGTAIIHLLNNPLARDWSLRTLLLSLPEVLLKIMTWSILLMELAFLPLCFHDRTRKFAWFGMVFMHLGILLIVDFADLTLGMLMIHLFTFDDRWLNPLQYNTGKAIVFFDGICGICNKFIDFLFKEDREKVLLFAPLQGETADKNLNKEFAQKADTIVFKNNKGIYFKSDAVLEIFRSMGGIWKLAVAGYIIPAFLRDGLYDIMSGKRYQWFGKKETCRIPSAEEKERFLN